MHSPCERSVVKESDPGDAIIKLVEYHTEGSERRVCPRTGRRVYSASEPAVGWTGTNDVAAALK